MATAKELQELEEASNASGELASAKLDVSLQAVMRHVARIDQLNPKMGDEATYRRLVALVQEATHRNESAAALRAKIERLGAGAVAMMNEMAKVATKIT